MDGLFNYNTYIIVKKNSVLRYNVCRLRHYYSITVYIHYIILDQVVRNNKYNMSATIARSGKSGPFRKNTFYKKIIINQPTALLISYGVIHIFSFFRFRKEVKFFCKKELFLIKKGLFELSWKIILDKVHSYRTCPVKVGGGEELLIHLEMLQNCIFGGNNSKCLECSEMQEYATIF